MTLYITYDADADAVYVRLASPELDVADTREVDWQRTVDYDENGELIGVEFLGVSRGIDLTGVPDARRVEDAIRSLPKVASFLARAAS